MPSGALDTSKRSAQSLGKSRAWCFWWWDAAGEQGITKLIYEQKYEKKKKKFSYKSKAVCVDILCFRVQNSLSQSGIGCVHILEWADVIISDGGQAPMQLYGREISKKKMHTFGVCYEDIKLVVFFWMETKGYSGRLVISGQNLKAPHCRK